MFFKNIHVRIKILLAVLIFLFILVIGKVFYTQVFSYRRLNMYAMDLWSRNLPIEANRGRIYDRNGRIIADNITTTSLILIPNQIENKEETARLIAPILGMSYESMLEHVSKRTSMERVHPEGRRLDFEIADQINSLNLSGVYLVKESKRHYPHETVLAHSLGFVGIDNQGLSGLELMYDEYLTGSYGAIKYFSDAKGNRLALNEIYQQPQAGINMTLTIDLDIQLALERELNNAVSKYNPEQALGIVMNPNTGELLAIASKPDFNPSNYQDYGVETINRNLPIWATYEPGSTFKIITLAASLEEKLVNLNNDTFFDSGSVTVGGARLGCWKHGGHGQQTFLQVVENSCNPGFVDLGLRLGKDKLFEYIRNFGFGVKTGVDLSGEGNGILFDVNNIGDLETATTAFGQGVSVTPIQQVAAVSAAINGGVLFQPYIVKSLNEPETNSVIDYNLPIALRKIISDNTSSSVRHALESVVANGTGRNAYIPNFRVGGKTGTAQKVQDGIYMIDNYILSFIGFFPADNPEVVVYISVDNPKGVTQYGGTVAAPIARGVMMQIINSLGIEPREGGMEKEFIYGDRRHAVVPDVIGMTTKEALPNLRSFKVEFTGTGSRIRHQSPRAGTMIYEGDTIRLLLIGE